MRCARIGRSIRERWEDFDRLRAQLGRIEAEKGETRPTMAQELHDVLTDESKLQ